MCGIAGTINFSSKKADWNLLKKMSTAMIDRGPDAEGIRIMSNNTVGFAHRRLSIIDLSDEASQPMSNNDDTVWVVFNGEIYNHSEIREEINRKTKVCWKTDHSDTEVIIRAYELWGLKCISKFRGMFAIALYDSKKEKIWLIRDRLGIKPLYYGFSKNKLNFASTVNALLQDNEQSRIIDKSALYDFISLLAVPAPNTLFEKIKKVPAGYLLEISLDGKIKSHCYWDLCKNIHSRPIDKDIDKIKKELMEKLKESVELRKVSDVPIGLFLSGGVDSSTNLALFCNGKNVVNTFTVGYKNTTIYHNENDNAKFMADYCNAVHHDKIISQHDVIDFIDKFKTMCDDPVADPVIVSQYYIAKMASENGLKVVQCGEGADELFAGYSHWENTALYERLNAIIPLQIKKYMYNKSDKLFKKISAKDKEILRRGANGEAICWGRLIYINEEYKRKLFSNNYLNEIIGHNTWDNFKTIYKKCYKKIKKEPTFWLGYVNMKYGLPDLLLARTDKACMASSLEGRVPFLDHKLVEWGMQIPEKLKVKDHIHKYILKETVREIVPEEILYRPKEGFGLPYSEWYSGELGKIIKDNVNLFIDESGFFNKKEVNRVLRKQSEYSNVIWALFILSLWWQQYANVSKKGNII